MQIHEITLKQKSQIDEGFLDKAKQSIKQGQIDRKVNRIADKALSGWTTYKAQLDKYYASTGKPAPANAYSSALMNFVQKNLMTTPIASANNKADIINLVKQISGATQPKPAEQEPVQQEPVQQEPVQQPAQQPVQQEPVQQPAQPNQMTPTQQATELEKQVQAQNAQAQQTVAPQAQQPVAPTTAPVASAPTTKTMGRVPSTPGTAPTVAPRGRAPMTTLKRGAQRPRTVQEAANDAQLKQLFTQLVRAASLATPEIDMGDEEEPSATTPGASSTSQAPAATTKTTKTPRVGQRYKIVKPPQAGQEQPSYYYKYSDGHWENELGDRVPAENSSVLEKYLDVNKGARVEQDPNYHPQYTFPSKKKIKKGRKK